MLAAADGNVSQRMPRGQILITPTQLHKGFIKAKDLAVVDLKSGRVVRGSPSGERAMHLEIYRRYPQAQAVIHAHPPHAVAWSIARPELRELPAESMSELILALGRIPIIPYARPGTQDMGTTLVAALGTPPCRVAILARHGAVSWGESIEEAYRGMERLEHAAYILKLAEDLGGITPLAHAEVQHLRAMRRDLGEVSL